MGKYRKREKGVKDTTKTIKIIERKGEKDMKSERQGEKDT
jgi:hypothetical protein